ncbi:MAG: CpsD/CapB family tyrosine-protein kinase, partial [Planctomycetes bacterium]|nr:CpsD/CapB family tyrosine-protein kinase [Planctomycetota bacterium]
GKSFVAFNLAAYYAIEGYKTLLLVADLRNPTLEPFPEMALTAKPGYLDYLESKETDEPMILDEVIMKTYIDNLSVFGPGTKKNINPTRLFDQEYFQAFLDELLEQYDTIILDSPPLMPVVDSSLILKCVKSAIMVLNLGRVKKKDFEDTIRRLQIINAPISGMVINRDQYAVRRKYYAYYSSGYISGI